MRRFLLLLLSAVPAHAAMSLPVARFPAAASVRIVPVSAVLAAPAAGLPAFNAAVPADLGSVKTAQMQLAAKTIGYQPGVMGLIQYDADANFGDYDTNRDNLTALALQAVNQGAKIIVMPEGSHYGYATKEELWCSPGMSVYEVKFRNGGSYKRNCRDVSGAAESAESGRSTQYWAQFAKKHGVYVLFDIPEAAGGRFYNTLVAVGPEGYRTKYRKRALYIADKAYATPGDVPVVLETPYGRFGLLICMDANTEATPSNYYAEYRALGVNAVILSMDWDDDPNDENIAARTFFQRMARENGFGIFASDAAPWDGTAFYDPGSEERTRRGLAPVSIGQSGVSVHGFQYFR